MLLHHGLRAAVVSSPPAGGGLAGNWANPRTVTVAGFWLKSPLCG